MTSLHAAPTSLDKRADIDEIDQTLGVVHPGGDPTTVHSGGDSVFTWDYARSRSQLDRLYEKGKTSQWNSTTDLEWDTVVDQEAQAHFLANNNPETVFLKMLAKDDPSCPVHGWTEQQFERLGFEQQSYALSNFLHGEQGALICTSKIVEQAPWVEAKYYAASQVMDEARHVEVFSKYLETKLEGEYRCSGHLFSLLDDIVADERWDMTYLGMQVMVEGLALAAFSLLSRITDEPLLKKLLRYVMSDEARHVAFGVLSLREVYEDMGAAEIRERQEFAYEAAILMRDKQFADQMWERLDVDPRAMLAYYRDNIPTTTTGLLFSKLVPNLKKLGLLDAGDGWLRTRFEEMDVIQYEDWVDTTDEYEALDAVAGDRAS